MQDFWKGVSTKVYSLKGSAGSETTTKCVKHNLQNAEHVLAIWGVRLGPQDIFGMLAFRY